MQYTDRQIEIIEAATYLIGEKGIQNLTTKNLAQKMSFSEPALYRHFINKTEILKSVLLYYKQQLKTSLSAIIQYDQPALDKIEAMMTFQFLHFSKTPAVIMVIFSETSFQYDNTLSQTVAEIMNQKKTMVDTIITQGQSEGSIRKNIEASQLSTIIMGSMRFTVLKWRLSEYNHDLIKEGKLLSKTINSLIKA